MNETTNHEMPLGRQAPVLGMRTSSLRPVLPPADSVTSPQAIVTLGQVRCGPRNLNEYVESPRPLPVVPPKLTAIGLNSSPSSPPNVVTGPSQSPRINPSHRSTLAGGGGGNGVGGVGHGGVGHGGSSHIISSQPAKSPPLKEEVDPSSLPDKHSSIICSKCGKCKCAACTEPRELPSRWCCGNRCELSARKALDYCTCFCCVQTAFYHCGAEEDNACYDDACACGGRKCCSRWTCMAVSSVFLPCLWFYWPLRGCLAAVTSCYNSCRKKGCECGRRPPDKCGNCVSKHSQTRRLLVDSDSSSA